MGSELYRTQPTFRRAIDRCGELLQAHLDRPLIALLFGGDGAASALEATVSAQPALFALEWALAELWASWGVEPAAMLGHSVGEYVAACRAGVFSLEEGLRLIAAQGRLIQALPVGGAMAAIRADEARVRRAMAAERGELDLAALNAPDQVVISGRSGAVEAVLARLAAQGIGGARLAVPHALHSALIEPMLAEFARVAASVRYAEPTVPLVSSLTGQPFGAGDLPGAGYWARQAREPVRFARGIETLFSQGHRLFLELGPAPTLCSLGAQCVPHGAAAWLPSLRPGRPDWESLLASLGTLYRRGTRVSWKGFDRDYPRRIQSLPGYAFERKRFWFQNAAGPSVSATPAARWSIAVAAAGRQADQVPIDLALHTYAAKYQALGRLAAAYIVRALRSLGAFAAAGATLGPEDLVETAGIRPIYGSLMSTWLKKLVDSGLLREHGGRFVADRPLPEAHPEAIIEAERSLFEDAPALLRYVEGCGRLLPDVITGRESALETLFPGGSFDLAEEVYERAALSRYFNGIVRSVAESLTTSAPPGRPIRVVEVGAGTGGTTAAILPYLPPGRVEYDFTDVSEFFLARAEERFGDFPFVRYGLLDLERDPVAQGFACHQYDLVIAANVVHATTDLARTIDRLCALLVPDGALVLYEVTDPPPYVDVTVALIEGWQKFDDGLRDGGPLLDVGRWRALLQARGLAEVVSLPAEGSPAGLLSSHVLIARGPGGTGVPVAGPAPAASAPVATAVGRPRPEAAGPEADDGGDGVLRALDRTPVSEHVEVLVDFVRRQVARVLRRDSFETIGRDHRLMDLGLDSLMAVALRDRLGRALRLDRPLPATLIFDYPCVADIAALLAARLGEPPVEQAVMTHSRDEFTPSLPVGAAGLNGLSDAEVERLLLEKLETL
jgi:malonyl CoA-acyl carrier protein transacylase/SAM-dependent methyltransferase